MNKDRFFGGILKSHIHPAAFVGIIVLALVLAGWLVYDRTGLSGARNPPGTPGNTDPHLGGPNSVLQRGQGSDRAANAPGGQAGAPR